MVTEARAHVQGWARTEVWVPVHATVEEGVRVYVRLDPSVLVETRVLVVTQYVPLVVRLRAE